MKKSSLTIATRQSPLALWQAHHIKTRLEHLHPGLRVHLLGMTTEGDRFLEKPLYEIGGKGLFVKELETALLEGRADLAVHSLKDMPARLPEGLCISTYCEREDPRDALIANHFTHLDELPIGATVGSSSLRRQCQLKALRPDLNIIPLRGNVGSRLAKLDRGEFAAIILAAAGLKRLQLDARIRAYFSAVECLPAIGQGVLALECRSEDTATQALLAPLDHIATRACVLAERALNAALGGSCHTPIAGYAILQDEQLILKALVGKPDGSLILRTCQTGLVTQASLLGQQAAQDLLAQGANEILQAPI